MKRFSFALALIFATLSLPSYVYASNMSSDEPLVKVKKVENKVITVVLANLEQARTTVSITDLGEFTTFFQEKIVKHNGYGKKLDLSKLPKGRYLLNVKQGTEKSTKVIVVDNETVRVSNGVSR